MLSNVVLAVESGNRRLHQRRSRDKSQPRAAVYPAFSRKSHKKRACLAEKSPAEPRRGAVCQDDKRGLHIIK